jgi:tRNA threonylcarbamoyladenosine biosynthesis protein TsaB
MRILAIDTSVGVGSVAAVDDRGTTERSLGPAGDHARVLTAILAAAATERGWGTSTRPLGDLGPHDAVAVVTGPGSFTGLRVGVTAAKTLAWATGARLIGVSGFEVIALRAERVAGWNDVPIAIAYDAGRGEVWAATASPATAGWTVTSPALARRAEWLDGLPAGAHVAGPALAVADAVAGRSDLVVPPAEAWHPSAADAAALARGRAEAGLFADPFTLVPDYMRPSYAEEKRGPGGG